MDRTIKIFDTTLRDGEQSPGCSMSLKEKLQIALQLEKLGVDVIEAGFAISSNEDFESISQIAKTVKNIGVASLARANKKDIDRAWEAVQHAKKPRIHIFIATSDIHLQYKLKMSRTQALQKAREMVAYGKSLCEDIEFSAEDATRSDRDYLVEIITAVIDAGATVINVPDTVGYTTPDEFAALISYLKEHVPNIDKATISVHCHNDLGLAVANSLAAVKAGADQVECTINGIGERAGNAALEEVVMGLTVRKDHFGVQTKIATEEIFHSSKMISSITGSVVQANKAIVGKNAFAHEAGIHQHGVLENKETYEIMTPQSVGILQNSFVLGKHSGKHAFENKLSELGYTFDKKQLEEIFVNFKTLADKKKDITDLDLEALAQSKVSSTLKPRYSLEDFTFNSGMDITPTVNITLKDEKNGSLSATKNGDGLVDAAFKAIEELIARKYNLNSYIVKAIGSGEDAQGQVSITLENRENKKSASGYGLATDVVEASIKAFLNAVNKMELLCD